MITFLRKMFSNPRTGFTIGFIIIAINIWLKTPIEREMRIGPDIVVMKVPRNSRGTFEEPRGQDPWIYYLHDGNKITEIVEVWADGTQVRTGYTYFETGWEKSVMTFRPGERLIIHRESGSYEIGY